MRKMQFASDNFAGIDSSCIEALNDANKGVCGAYGNDPWTQEAYKLFKAHFGEEVEIYFVSTGTAANVLGISSFLSPFNAVIAAESSHINTDECGAFEHYTGCKIVPVKTGTGKLTVKDIASCLDQRGNVHRVQPLVVSLSQPTELGTLYSQQELKELVSFAHSQGLIVHIDGARLSNAAAALGVSLRALTQEVGIDVLSFGGTKNGMMGGEAVLFFTPSAARNFPFIRKQGMQLTSKMRFISAQFVALLSNSLWLKNASHANKMAQLLKQQLESVPEVTFAYPLLTNALFAQIVHKAIIDKLLEEYLFYVWNPQTLEVRWMTSFATTEEEVLAFAESVKKVCEQYRNGTL